MQTSPFVFGTLVHRQAFTNRELELKKLKNNLVSGINTMIISPRRWGKSSLVEKTIREIEVEHPNIKIVSLDLFSARSEQEFLENLAKECIKVSSGKWSDWIESGKQFFTRMIPRLSVGNDPYTDFSLSFDWKEVRTDLDEIINLPQTIAEKKKVRLVVCIDEFQNLSRFPDYEGLERKLRAAWQKHTQVSYCLYGSKRHMMLDIFNNASKPFYRFGDLMLLNKIKEESWVDFLVSSFERSNKRIGAELAANIARAMKNHPWYVQQLAHYTWHMTDVEANQDTIQAAIEELLGANSPLYTKEVETISSTQLNLLIAIAKGETQLTSVRVMQDNALGTSANVLKNKQILKQADLIDDTDAGYEFLDPAFELWFKRAFRL